MGQISKPKCGVSLKFTNCRKTLILWTSKIYKNNQIYHLFLLEKNQIKIGNVVNRNIVKHEWREMKSERKTFRLITSGLVFFLIILRLYLTQNQKCWIFEIGKEHFIQIWRQIWAAIPEHSQKNIKAEELKRKN